MLRAYPASNGHMTRLITCFSAIGFSSFARRSGICSSSRTPMQELSHCPLIADHTKAAYTRPLGPSFATCAALAQACHACVLPSIARATQEQRRRSHQLLFAYPSRSLVLSIRPCVNGYIDVVLVDRCTDPSARTRLLTYSGGGEGSRCRNAVRDDVKHELLGLRAV